MTLRKLEVFLKVTETLNMQEAARALFISAPSVSGMIAEMERDCGFPLFERLGKRLYLTPGGLRMQDYARRLLGLYGEMQRQMNSAPQQLRLGVTMSVASSVLLPALRRLDGPKPRVVVLNTREVEARLLDNRIDLGYVEGRVRDAKLRVTPVLRDTLVLACAPEHPFARQKSVTLEELAQADLLVREMGSGTRERLAAAFEGKRLQPRVLWECGSIDALLRAVRDNVGVTVLSSRLLPDGLCGRAISGFDGTRWLSLVWHEDKVISPAMRGAIDAFMAQRESESDGAGGGFS